LESAREAVRLGMLPPDGLFLAGLLASRAGDGAQARDWFDRALAADPGLLARKHDTALRMEREGRLLDAASILREILAADPEHAPTLFNLGRVLLLAGRPAQAVAPLRKGLEIEDDSRARAMLDQALREAGTPRP
jgi:tetratricopeptide (TPR) repeat protein